MDTFVFTEHAEFEFQRRGITKEDASVIIRNPGQTLKLEGARMIYQGRVKMGLPEKEFLIRVFVDVDRNPPEVVTAYRTSKIAKYWRETP